MTRKLTRWERRIIRLSVNTLQTAMSESGKRKADGDHVRLALACLYFYCPERWPLTCFLDAAGQENEIGRAQGTTAAYNGIVRQLRAAGCYEDVS